MTDKIIRDSGGPPKPPPSPTRSPDTLNSRQFATIQDLISEGEIEGFATASKEGRTKGTPEYNNAALKDVFLNDTPILKSTANSASPADADFNFQNVNFTPRFGTANQTTIPGIVGSESTSTVGGTPTNPAGTVASGESNAVTRQITNTNVDAVKVTITFPQLQKSTDNGDLLGSTVDLVIQVQYNGGGFNDVLSDTITGRTADAYEKEYRVNFTGAFPVDVRVVRLTIDSTSDQLADEFRWTSIGEIVDDAQTYPNSAYTSLRLDSEQFSSIPKRAFRVRGIKVRIPGAGASNSGTPTVVSNQTIATNLGLGTCSSFGFIHYPENYIFNGTMAAAQWCSDPAMILLDLLTTERYGFGTHITDANLDLFSFVAASRYCTGNKGGSEPLDDGTGASEARFSCNVNIQSSKEAFDLIKDLATVMRCIAIWSAGSITITQDRPTDSSYLFSLANVTSEGFNYTGSSLRQRHSVVSVSYFNMDSREIDFEVVEDTSLQSKIGIVKKDVKAFACTSRGQAQRLGKAIIFSESQESEVVNFSTSMDAGAIVRPGSVISINDPVRAGVRRSGRINTASTTQITVDNTQDLSGFSGTNQQCSVILSDGSVETKSISGISNNVITVSSAFSSAPNANSIWLIQSDSVLPQTFRVVSVEEQDGVNYSISALTYVAGKYDNIEQGISLPDRSISLLNQPKDPPGNLQAKERVVVINALAITKLIVTWVGVTGVSQYLVQYRFNNTNWVSEIVFRTDFELLNIEAGAYEFKVFSYNAALELSATSTDLTFNAIGKTLPPGDVQNLSMEPITNKLVRLRWTKTVDPYVLHGGRVYVRHSNLADGTGTFQSSVDLVTALAGNSTDVIVPSLEGEYILKFQDDQGNFSVGEASIIQDLPDLVDTQIILQDREDTDTPPFNNNDSSLFTNTTFNSATSALQLTDPTAVKTGTYSQSGTTITITSSSHGIVVDESIKIKFTSGDAVNGIYIVASVADSNTLTVTSTKNITTSGNVTINRGLIGEYKFKDTLNLGAVFSLDLKRVIRSIGFVVDSSPIPATYTQSGTTVTITSNSHGRIVGNTIEFDATSGGGTDGTFVITAVTTNTFTFTAASSQTIGTSNCTFQFVNTIDEIIPSGSFWDDYALDGNFDGQAADEANCQIQVATSQSATASFGSFNNFANGTFRGHRFKFKLVLETTNTAQNMNVQRAGYTAEFQSRTELNYQTTGGTSSEAQQSGTSAKTVTFAKPFFVGTTSLGGERAFMPTIGITIENAQSGDFFTISQPTNNDAGKQFTVSIKNGSSFVDRSFTFQAVGYGKGV